MTEHYPVEPFTEEQEQAVYLFRWLEKAEADPKVRPEQRHTVRMKIADLNNANDWTMAQVAEASRLNYWPPKETS